MIFNNGVDAYKGVCSSIPRVNHDYVLMLSFH